MDCPKCKSKKTWIEQDRYGKFLRCLCGLTQMIEKYPAVAVIEKSVPTSQVKLPRKGSMFYDTLAILASLELATSATIAQAMMDAGKTCDVSNVSTYLTIMKGKGLVRVVENKRGLRGGSTWAVTDVCKSLLG